MIDPEVREIVRELLVLKNGGDIDAAEDDLNLSLRRAENIQARAVEVSAKRAELAGRRDALEQDQGQRLAALHVRMCEASDRYHAAAAALESARIQAERDLSCLSEEDCALLASIRPPRYTMHPEPFKVRTTDIDKTADPRPFLATVASPMHVGGGWVNVNPHAPMPMPGGNKGQH